MESNEIIKKVSELTNDITEETLNPALQFSPEQIDKINERAWDIRMQDAVLMLKMASLSYEKAKAINYEKGLTEALYLKGVAYGTMGKIDQAIPIFYEALKLFEKLDDSRGIAKTELAIGITHYRKFNIYVSIAWLFKALQDAIDAGEYDLAAKIKMNMSSIYLEAKLFDEAEKLATEALDYYKQKENKAAMSLIYQNLSMIYATKGDIEKANELVAKSIDIALEINAKQQTAYACMLQGEMYENLNEIKKALALYSKAAEIFDVMGDEQEKINAYSKIIRVLLKQNNLLKAMEYLQKIENITTNFTPNPKSIKRIAMLKAQLFEAKKDYEKALKFYKEAIKIYEEYDEETGKQMIFAYEELIKLTQIQNLYLIKYGMEYASRLQKALLHDEENLKQYFPNSFAFLKPKKAISGDFLWTYKDEETEDIFVAVVDCTGHGIPAGMLSILGLKLFEDAVIQKKLKEPGKILRFLHQGVRKTLHQDEENCDYQITKDGMEAGLIRINPRKGIIQFAGAMTDLFVMSKSSKERIRGNRFPIGGEQMEIFRIFETRNLPYQKNVSLYITTDGYIDQFGGPDKKRFTSKRFQNLLEEIQSLNMQQQKEKIIQTFNEWKGNEEQLDDILVVGIKI